MMRLLLNKTFVRSFSAVVLLVALTACVSAQSAPDQQGVMASAGDLAGYFGYSNLPGADGSTHFNFGGSAGVNLSPNFAVLGEYSYMPMGKLSGVDFNTQLFGGAVRLNLANSKHVVPYAVVGAGYNRLSGTESGVSAAVNGYYAAFGGGASVYLGKNWGIRPEFRYERQDLTVAGTTGATNVVQGSASVFFQFGGRGRKKT